jgi:alanyl-tRNA synthetase
VKAGEIRKLFLDFFKSRRHEIVRSSSLIPRGDPTLLFTNAGMVQFKSFFIGEEKSPYARAASSQKCMRAGGKHSDLENVGRTARHHTFFEMLGNFSFGDYFKRDAILFAWDLLIEQFSLPKDQLWVSVFEQDDEAADLWLNLTGIQADRVVRLGARDNFWQMGDTGPCGPCSEIIVDQGAGVGCGKEDCAVGCDCDRFLEIWNLVFMQYNMDAQGNLAPLPDPSIDTGMGLERVSAVMQGKLNNFDIDLFLPTFSAIALHTHVGYGDDPSADTSMRVIADHIRASAFLLAEGLMPSNEGRGYVLRRIIRRASRHARLLGIDKPVLHKLLDSVLDAMGDAYPELCDNPELSSKILLMEEERFARTLDAGLRLMEDIVTEITKSGQKVIPGDEIFRLYDTFGFPVDLARDIAADNGLLIDETGFEKEMKIQRERARASWVGEEEAVASIYRELRSEIGRSAFVGYETLTSRSGVLAIVRNGKVVGETGEGAEAEVFLDRTPFYGESGGQVGDAGEITGEQVKAVVLDTKKPIEGLHSHIVKVKKGTLRTGEMVTCRVDDGRRKAIMRNHTATHLLNAALRTVLGDHIKQAGSLVTPSRLRFDFTHFSALSQGEVSEIEKIVQEKIWEDRPVVTNVMDTEIAVRSGATALFGEKYGDTARVVGVPGFSSELCGGTHCSRTGEIGLFVISSEGSIASGVRRIEALTGEGAFYYLKGQVAELDRIREILKTDQAYARIEKIISDMKNLERETDEMKARLAAADSSGIIRHAREIEGVTVLSHRVDGFEQRDLRMLADNLRDRIGSGIIFIASAKDGKGAMLAMVTKDLAGRFNAGWIMKEAASLAGGKGGGRVDMAQGGTSNIEALDKAVASVFEIIRNLSVTK